MQTFKDTQTNQVWQFEDDVLIKEVGNHRLFYAPHQLKNRWTFPRRSNRSTSRNSAWRRAIPGAVGARPNISRPPLPRPHIPGPRRREVLALALLSYPSGLAITRQPSFT